jgi:hypothetical protein
LDYAGESSQDFAVGDAVAISGDGTTVLLGDSSNPSGGGAFVFHVLTADVWADSSAPNAILSDSNSGGDDGLGNALALSGDGTVALLGAPGASNRRGAVDVFHVLAEAAWATTSTPTATLTNAGGSSDDFLGVRVRVSSDGTTALVTAPNVNGDRGAAYIFRVADEASWASSSTPTATLTNSAAKSHDDMGGAALSADGATALGGAPGVRFQTGAANLFHVSDASSWVSTSTPTAILTNSALNSCVVPRLKKLTVPAAKAALKARSCRLGRVRRVHATRGRRGHVISQSLKPGSRPPVGTRVAIKVKK